MNTKLIELQGNTVVLQHIKSITHSDDIESNCIKIHFKTRKEYIFNPESEKWELHSFDDVLSIPFDDSNSARKSYHLMSEQWQFSL